MCRVPVVLSYHQHTEPSHLIASLFMVLTISLQGSISPLLCLCVVSVYVFACPSSTSPGINITPWSAMAHSSFHHCSSISFLRSPSVFAAYPSQGSIHWGPDSTDSVCPRPHFQGSIPFPVSRVLYHFCISYTFY